MMDATERAFREWWQKHYDHVPWDEEEWSQHEDELTAYRAGADWARKDERERCARIAENFPVVKDENIAVCRKVAEHIRREGSDAP